MLHGTVKGELFVTDYDWSRVEVTKRDVLTIHQKGYSSFDSLYVRSSSLLLHEETNLYLGDDAMILATPKIAGPVHILAGA